MTNNCSFWLAASKLIKLREIQNYGPYFLSSWSMRRFTAPASWAS